MSADLKEQDLRSETWRQDHDHQLHPFQHFSSFKEDGALVIQSGQDCYITDEQGNRYFDAVGGMWCTNIGLGRNEMADAIAAQVREMAYVNPFSDMTNLPSSRLAAKLADIAPGNLNHVLFSCGGSTANDLGYRIIRMYQNARGKPNKRHILSRVDSYHGSTYFL
jgi:adenosylmethionine-8-amino-7-oxononanoate aminotransferase